MSQRFLCLQVNASGTLDPATHAYAFWEGIPVKARTAFGELFAKSSTLTSVAIVQRAIRRQSPAELMAELKFGSLLLVDTLKGIHMSGEIPVHLNLSHVAPLCKTSACPSDSKALLYTMLVLLLVLFPCRKPMFLTCDAPFFPGIAANARPQCTRPVTALRM